ncbi:RagB/SusD family nutrient uptake outer membrane protein [Sphingobacterium arenae]|uniref:RagB/SusD family nutrient uptake outer membrane protein n=1 Tax=Sphingobacterium arenae TaxID=1280598 RepID=A0ABR7Y6Q2_9SPHI|nr:RagB/SusD family nutrient uptake outer membrane protein [Sphingobacterium arenae]MBD1426991.1 RagB/SusD family nutrient uptake outer membrane protein [Sphingobacterium arenae]
MKKTIIYTLALFTIGLASCSKWLDIQPESEIDRSLLFTTEAGFKEALLGIYIRCSKIDLYGRELTVGTPEVLVQNYQISTADNYRYQQTKNYRYNDADFIRRKDSIWVGLYNGIVNANLILEEIDSKENLFTGDNYRLVKGESLALRGYLHFDLLRMFAPAHHVSPEAKAIPYVTSYSNRTTEMATVSGALDSVIKDLEQAKELLVEDPIRSSAYIINYPTITDTLLHTELHHSNLFLQNRRHRLNYYAVCGALARVYLYKDDKVKALENALIIINEQKFPWTNATDFLAVADDKKDRILYKELLFGWYIPTLNNSLNSNWFTESQYGMYLDDTDTQTIYETSDVNGDMRYTQWFSTASASGDFYSTVIKYRRNPLGDTFAANLHYMMAPAIRLSEIYYIAAESVFPSDPTRALAYFDEVRQHRGIGDKLQADNLGQFQTELLKEYRKEMYAEGQLFYAYKRLNAPIIGLRGEVIPVNQQLFVWPLPSDEIIYGQR